jgi:hypothetical protein
MLKFKFSRNSIEEAEDDNRASQVPGGGCPQQEETAATDSRPQGGCVSHFQQNSSFGGFFNTFLQVI